MSGPDAPERWLTVAEAAKHFGVSGRTLYRLVEERTVPFRRLPGTGTVRFSLEDIAEIEAAVGTAPAQVTRRVS